MAGSLEYGMRIKDNRAYAEGREAAFTGASNPHANGAGTGETYDAWQAGVAASEAGSVDSTARSGVASYAHDQITFTDGDYLTRGGDLTGIGSTSRFTLAFSITPGAIPTTGILLATNDTLTNFVMYLQVGTTGSLSLNFADTVANGGVDGIIALGSTPLGQKSTVLIAARTTDNSLVCYINGVAQTLAPTWYGTDAIDFALNVSDWRIGRNFAGTGQYLGTLGFLYFTTGTTDAHYLTDPELFFSSSGGEKDFTAELGGDIPNPKILFGIDQTAANINAGTARSPATGGNWTASGTFT